MIKTSIYELHYTKTNTYLIDSGQKTLLFDTGWAGTFAGLEEALHGIKKSVRDIDYILMSHYHPDHCGLAQEIADGGAAIIVPDVQISFLHCADSVYEKEGNKSYRPVKDADVTVITCGQSRDFLASLGIEGEILHTPGHSDDSISLVLDEGAAFVGDLNPLYELELHKGTQIAESWDKILEKDPHVFYYGHAKTYRIDVPVNDTKEFGNADDAEESENTEKIDTFEKARKKSGFAGLAGFFKAAGFGKSSSGKKQKNDEDEMYALVSDIMSMIDRGVPIDKICNKTGADHTMVEDVSRMYLTHPGVSVQGILDRIEIKGR